LQFQAERGQGFGASAGGRWVIDHFAGVRFRDFLASRGFVAPKPNGAIYGSARLT
jgi:hypothetical protein